MLVRFWKVNPERKSGMAKVRAELRVDGTAVDAMNEALKVLKANKVDPATIAKVEIVAESTGDDAGFSW